MSVLYQHVLDDALAASSDFEDAQNRRWELPYPYVREHPATAECERLSDAAWANGEDKPGPGVSLASGPKRLI